jgi:hypothetical protein
MARSSGLGRSAVLFVGALLFGIRVANVFHIAFRGMEHYSILRDDIHTRVFMMEPDWRREGRNIQDYLDTIRLHLIHNLVEPSELEPPAGRLKGIPGEVAHPYQVKPGFLHNGDVAMEFLGCTIHRLVTSTDKKLPLAGPNGMVGDALC